MSQSVVTQLLTLLAGAVLGMLGTTFKGYYDRRAESRRAEEAAWLSLLSPLRIAAEELRGQLAQAFERVRSERELPVARLTDGYHLRRWFAQCKDYVTVPPAKWPDDQRLEHFAMHSGGEGTEAASTLYVTAKYLFYATEVRFRPPYIASRTTAERLRGRIDAVRRAYEAIEFYPVTQDSTGLSMKTADGTVKNYRQFGESLTDRAERGWFMTLTDVHFKLHEREPGQVNEILRSLDALVALLRRS